MSPAEILTWLRLYNLTEILSFFAGLASALLAVKYRDRTEAGRKRNESVRALITCAMPLDRALSRARDLYEQTARYDPQRVPDLFRAEEDLVSPEELTALSSAVERSSTLPVPCSQRWVTAVNSIRAVQRQHAALRSLTGRSGARAHIVERRHEYAQQLRQALDELSIAAEATTRFAPPDARTPLNELIRKG